jgi:hypothetical protein
MAKLEFNNRDKARLHVDDPAVGLAPALAALS